MYQVPHFRETELPVLHDHIRAHPLGLLISPGPEGVIANAIPFLLYAEGERGTLRAHLSRGNPQWQALRHTPAALVVFQGVDRYITPNWYPQKTIDQKVVPTWNYAIVQARGTARIIEDADWLRTHVSALTDTHEGRQPQPWSLADAPERFVAGQLKGIVGLEIPIAAIEGKFKASQNRPVADRAGVAEGLTAAGDAEALAMAALVRARGGV